MVNQLDNFQSKTEHFLMEIGIKYSVENKKMIRYEELKVISEDLFLFKPKSKIKKEKKLLLDYLEILSKKKASNLTKQEIVTLESKYILPIVNKFSKRGYRIKNSWIFAALFFTPFDIVLHITGISRYYLFLPLLSLIFVAKMLYSELRAKNQKKLW